MSQGNGGNLAATATDMSNKTLEDLLNVQKQQFQLSLGALATQRAQERKSKFRFHFIIFAILFWLIGKYIALRTQFTPLFNIYNQSKGSFDSAICSAGFNTPWSIALTVSYPWTRNFFEQPLEVSQAQFIWYAVNGAMVPTLDQINDTTTAFGKACAGLNLAPLSFLCGNVFDVWSKATGHDLNYIIQNVQLTPWNFWLSPTSSILSGDPLALQQLVTGGLIGYVRVVGNQTPDEIYKYLFAKNPPPPSASCNIAGGITNIVTGAGSGMMIPMALGIPFANPLGALAFIGLGIAGATASSFNSFKHC